MKTTSFPSSLLILDRSEDVTPYPALYPFAIEELICRSMHEGARPILHIWRHPRAFIMGLRDSRLPAAAAAKGWLHSQGYAAAVRNSGGAAVPLDSGVVNITLMYPKDAGDMDHRKDFHRMVAMIREVLASLTGRVEQGEVTGSFCPGEFDLAIGGRKFCGIAQRRQQRAIAVQAFLIVEGRGMDKAALARGFYERAVPVGTEADYPHVSPGGMSSLAECLHIPLTSQHFVQQLLDVAAEAGIAVAGPADIADYPSEADILEMVGLMEQRYGILRDTP
ncbi:lipoate--protein ligase family protein [Paenibacillus ferrarius]|uniref:lipoate--protein ligase family protein n=1 Tax=Paenibacillus ferrarius TaxID=1469647 RepID=UPI003D27A714